MEKENRKDSLETLKKEYEKLEKKYSLESFKFLNEGFDIEQLKDLETDMFPKRIRKIISEKIGNLLRILELFQNPSNSSLFIFNVLKTFNEKDKEIISEVYRVLNELEVDTFGLDIKYSEQKEIEFIKKVSTLWPNIQKNLIEIEKSMKTSLNSKNDSKQRSYFG
jgi:hypothetical protein